MWDQIYEAGAEFPGVQPRAPAVQPGCKGSVWEPELPLLMNSDQPAENIQSFVLWTRLKVALSFK